MGVRSDMVLDWADETVDVETGHAGTGHAETAEEGGMDVQEFRLALPPIPPSISVARRLVRDTAIDLPEGLVADAELLTSEVVTNAIRYGGGNIELSADRADGSLTIAVYDDGDPVPDPDAAGPAPDAVSGRGLRIVAQVASEWGISTDPSRPGKTVWFRLESDDSAD